MAQLWFYNPNRTRPVRPYCLLAYLLGDVTISPPIQLSTNPQRVWTPPNFHPHLQIVYDDHLTDAHGNHYGYYLVATERIEPGTRLIGPAPDLVHRTSEYENNNQYLRRTLDDMYFFNTNLDFHWKHTPVKLLEFLSSLSSMPLKPPLKFEEWVEALSRVHNKMFPKQLGIYLQTDKTHLCPPALIPHSCDPNADIIRTSKRHRLDTGGVCAIRQIDAGEKITLNYLTDSPGKISHDRLLSSSWYAPKHIRDKELKSKWNMSSCTCNLCLDKDQSKMIDERTSSLKLDQQLEQQYFDMMSHSDGTVDAHFLLTYRELTRKLKELKTYPNHYILFRCTTELLDRLASSRSNTNSVPLFHEEEWLEIVRTHLSALSQHLLNPLLHSIHILTIHQILKSTQHLEQHFDTLRMRNKHLRKSVLSLIYQLAQTYLGDPAFRQLYRLRRLVRLDTLQKDLEPNHEIAQTRLLDPAESDDGILDEDYSQVNIEATSQAHSSDPDVSQRPIESTSEMITSSIDRAISQASSHDSSRNFYMLKQTEHEKKQQKARVLHSVDEFMHE